MANENSLNTSDASVAPPRRSSRARRVNSRFINDEVDESYRQLVARIAAPDSHSIQQTPQLAFHSTKPPPPPRTLTPPPPPVSSASKSNSISAGSCNVLNNVSADNKKISAICGKTLFVQLTPTLPCVSNSAQKIDANCSQSPKIQNLCNSGPKKMMSNNISKKGISTVNKSNHKLTEKDIEKKKKVKKKNNDGKMQNSSKGVAQMDDLDSEDDIPLSQIANKKSISDDSDNEPLQKNLGKASTSNSIDENCSLPKNYTIKTIHNPDISSTPISIVCIDHDGDETTNDHQQSQPPQKKIKVTKMLNNTLKHKNDKKAMPPKKKKLFPGAGVCNNVEKKHHKPKKKNKDLSNNNKALLKCSGVQPAQGKLLKILNIKLPPNVLSELSDNNPLRKLAESKPATCNNAEENNADLSEDHTEYVIVDDSDLLDNDDEGPIMFDYQSSSFNATVDAVDYETKYKSPPSAEKHSVTSDDEHLYLKSFKKSQQSVQPKSSNKERMSSDKSYYYGDSNHSFQDSDIEMENNDKPSSNSRANINVANTVMKTPVNIKRESSNSPHEYNTSVIKTEHLEDKQDDNEVKGNWSGLRCSASQGKTSQSFCISGSPLEESSSATFKRKSVGDENTSNKKFKQESKEGSREQQISSNYIDNSAEKRKSLKKERNDSDESDSVQQNTPKILKLEILETNIIPTQRIKFDVDEKPDINLIRDTTQQEEMEVNSHKDCTKSKPHKSSSKSKLDESHDKKHKSSKDKSKRSSSSSSSKKDSSTSYKSRSSSESSHKLKTEVQTPQVNLQVQQTVDCKPDIKPDLLMTKIIEGTGFETKPNVSDFNEESVQVVERGSSCEADKTLQKPTDCKSKGSVSSEANDVNKKSTDVNREKHSRDRDHRHHHSSKKSSRDKDKHHRRESSSSKSEHRRSDSSSKHSSSSGCEKDRKSGEPHKSSRRDKDKRKDHRLSTSNKSGSLKSSSTKDTSSPTKVSECKSSSSTSLNVSIDVHDESASSNKLSNACMPQDANISTSENTSFAMKIEIAHSSTTSTIDEPNINNGTLASIEAALTNGAKVAEESSMPDIASSIKNSTPMEVESKCSFVNSEVKPSVVSTLESSMDSDIPSSQKTVNSDVMPVGVFNFSSAASRDPRLSITSSSKEEYVFNEATKEEPSITYNDAPSPVDQMQLAEDEEEIQDSNASIHCELKDEKLEASSALADTSFTETKEVLKVEKPVLTEEEREAQNKAVVELRLKSFEHLSENLYLIDKRKSKQSKEVRRMVCDCSLTKEEIAAGEMGCGEDCLNRLLMIECGWRCSLGDACLNKSFQRCDYAPIEVFNAQEKGCGVRATQDILPGSFIMEYIGEVFDQREFRRRRKEYGKDGTAHFYFMALKADQFIDATRKGNISRFVNHSCDPNAETQKWTVNGELRVGFFALKSIAAGEEINFDYRMERYGREPQKCYCGTALCRGWLGEPPEEKTKEEKEEEKKKFADKKKKEDKNKYDDEIQERLAVLQRLGLRNRHDTLMLSRVMVRAEAIDTRMQLLQLLCDANTHSPCLRLFLDYHGLSLLWSWMADLSNQLTYAPLKLKILKTLEVLPIVNRTQVTDSKVMDVVERWSKETLEDAINSRKLAAQQRDDESEDEDSPQHSTPTEDHFEEQKEAHQHMNELATKLIESWKILNEEFRIPKKQRLELMKEHEKEVEADYRKYLNTERGRREMMERYRDNGRDSYYASWRSKITLAVKDRNIRSAPPAPPTFDPNDPEFAGLSKEERREKFALKVAQEDEKRRVQENMWTVHVERCAQSGLDPYHAPIVDPSGQYYWDTSLLQWFPLPQNAFTDGQQIAQGAFTVPPPQPEVNSDPHLIPILHGEVLPPVVVTVIIPPHWHMARDCHNRVYFYHSRSRQTQWNLPTPDTKTTLQYEVDSDTDSSSSSSDSEDFSSDEAEANDDDTKGNPEDATGSADADENVEGKIIRRQKGRKKHSAALVQERVISPIKELDRELARKERREAKERAKTEAKKERERLLLEGGKAIDLEDGIEDNSDIISMHKLKPKEKTKSKERAANALADNSEVARKIKDSFRSRIATFIVSVLNPYRKSDCKHGRINSTEDFKYLARKLTHFVMVKELKQLPSIEGLECSENVKHKTKEFVRKYMAKYGSSFKRDPFDTKEY